MFNILSTHDGISCLQLALIRSGVPYRYFASEINKNAIKITTKNFPNTIQLGDIEEVTFSRYLSYGNVSRCEVKKIDLLVGGFPCQGFSYAGKMLNFEDDRSKSFFEFSRLVHEAKPLFFIGENVKMKKEWQDIITENLFGVEPLFIDSQIIGAQQRKRNYWVGELQADGTYKKLDIPPPTGPGRNLQDFLEEDVDEKYYLTHEEIGRAVINCQGKTFKSGKKNGNAPLVRENTAICLTHTNFGKSNRQTNRIFDKKRKGIRILTPIEEERLQGLPDNYTAGFPDYVRREHIGNGFHVDTIEYILSFILEKLGQKSKNIDGL